MEDSLVGESQAKGLAEGAVKETKRVVRSGGQWGQLHGVTLDCAILVVPMFASHTGPMISRECRCVDGQTAFELTKGRPHRMRLPPPSPIAEKVM